MAEQDRYFTLPAASMVSLLASQFAAELDRLDQAS
jgi:hypothetical protein